MPIPLILLAVVFAHPSRLNEPFKWPVVRPGHRVALGYVGKAKLNIALDRSGLEEATHMEPAPLGDVGDYGTATFKLIAGHRKTTIQICRGCYGLYVHSYKIGRQAKGVVLVRSDSDVIEAWVYEACRNGLRCAFHLETRGRLAFSHGWPPVIRERWERKRAEWFGVPFPSSLKQGQLITRFWTRVRSKAVFRAGPWH